MQSSKVRAINDQQFSHQAVLARSYCHVHLFIVNLGVVKQVVFLCEVADRYCALDYNSVGNLPVLRYQLMKSTAAWTKRLGNKLMLRLVS